MKKPAITAQLVKDKAIGAINGWTDTINWTTQSMANLKGKEGEIKIEWGDGSHPTISIDKDFEGGGSGSTFGIKFTGTNGSSVTIGDSENAKTVTFASAPDSNVVVNVAGDSNAVTITFGVYYK